MIQPDELKKAEPLVWSTGIGTEVWALFGACIAGDLATIQSLMRKDPSLVRCHFNYRKPLYFAVRENRLAATAFLLDRDPNPIGLAVNDSLLEIARDRGYMEMEKLLEAKLATIHNISSRGEPVAEAIRQRDGAKMRSLLEASPELLHIGDLRSNQPIHWAAMTRQIDLIDELLQRGANIHARRCDGAQPIHLNHGDYHFRGWDRVAKDAAPTPRAIYEHLRARGAPCDICTAAWFGDLHRVRELCDRDPSLANRTSEVLTYYACSGTPLRNAAAGGHMEIVRLLLERGADPNLPEEGIAPRGHALHSAVVHGHIEIVKLLLERGAHPNVEIESSADTLSAALASAGYSTRPSTEMVELLCSHGAARGVHLLAYSGDVVTAAAVFAANPALADDPGALANAAGEGKEAFVRLMLRYQPELPRRVVFPSWSVGAKTRELNELLFRHGLDANTADWLGATALHHLAGRGDVEKAAWFLDHGANLQPRDEDLCSTPLGWAAKFGRRKMVEFLLGRGAQPNLPEDPPWATPLAWATRRGHREVAEILMRASD
jgi:ankyrin repeat protein